MPTSKRNLANFANSATNFGKIMHVPGSIINNRYQIIQRLGRLETGKTYLAKDLRAVGDSRCVLKQLDINCNHEAHWHIFQQHLLNEIAVLKRLGDHPQIPQLYQHFSANQQFYLVREYIDGDSLEQEVEGKIFQETDLIHLIQDVLRILDFIHKTKVIHRDVRPDHLIRRKQDNTFTLINFGAIREIESTEINLEGEVIVGNFSGNWSYVAPEQKSGESRFSSDIYALGRTAVYALTGKSPQDLEQTNLDWRKQCRISPKLEAILEKMMCWQIEQRYNSALEVLHDLRPLLKLKQIVGGRYSITRYLGGDDNIETYLANNLRRQYQSPCLVQQIELPSINSNDEVRLEQRFAEELCTLERLGYHDQVPHLWDHFVENGEFYLVQEYFSGKNLAQRIFQQNLSTAQIIQILVSALSALKFVHQNNVIHRNIKPINLIICDHNHQVILTNFGVLIDIKTIFKGTIDHSNKDDKLNYWSPEQIAGRPTLNSDLYALGMSIIEALTLVKPATFARDSQNKLPWAQSFAIDRRLVKIIDKMIQPDLGRRYQSADQVLKDLAKVNVADDLAGQKVAKLDRKNIPTLGRAKLTALPIGIALLGILCLLGSIEFAFPIIRPAYFRYQGHKMLQEQPRNALDVLNKAINLQPNNSLSWSGKGDALYQLGNYPQALSAYQKATKLDPNSADNWLKQGKVLARLENFTEAIAAYDQALKLEQADGEIYHFRGRALYQLQQYQAALTMQETALDLDRLNAAYLSGRALNLLKLGRSYDALSTFNRVQAFAPDSLELWQDKFVVLQALKRPQEAERVFREVSNNYIKALQEQPQNHQIWLAQADFLAKGQMYEKAIGSYSRAIELDSSFYQAWLGKGKALAQLGQNQQAIADLAQALQLRPRSYLAFQAQGLAYQNQNNFFEALIKYDRGLEINPDYPSLWRDRGLLLIQQQKYSQAIASLLKASNLTVYDPATWKGLAKAWNATGNIPKALTAINRAIKLNSQDPDLWNFKGSIYTQNGQYNEACDVYRKSRVSTGDSQLIIDSMMGLGCRMN